MKPSIGRIVHYQHPMELGSQTLPAIVVSVWSDTCVNLQVFTDGTNTHMGSGLSVVWVTSSTFDNSENPQPCTWNWPAKV